MLVLEGKTLFDKGKPVGTLDLKEGQKSDKFVILESCSEPLREVAASADDSRFNFPLMESEGKSPKVLLTLEGIFQRSDTVNANNRIYPESIWKKVLEGDCAFQKRLGNGEVLGEADHPKDGETLLSRVAGMTTKIWRNESNDKEIMGRLVVFDNEKGRSLKAIHDGGGRLGVSSRGNGSVVRMDGKDVVQEDYQLDTWDVVHNPSTPGAYPSEVGESTKRSGAPVTRTETVKKRALDIIMKGPGDPTFVEACEMAEKETVRRPRTRSEITETVSMLPVEKSKPLGEAMASVRERYRKLAGVDGPLTEEESKAISVFVQHVYTGKIQAGTGPLVARITFKGGSLGESIGAAEIRGATMEDLKKLVEDRIGSLGGAVEVEYDRSEEIYEECARRFSSLLEAQTSKVSDLTTKLSEAEAVTKRAQGKVTELSAKLSAATHIIEKFAARTKIAEGQSKDQGDLLGAAEKLIDALAEEFKEEGLRSAVAAIAATHSEMDELAEELCDATSLSEAVAITKRLKERRCGIMEREPLGIREVRVVAALRESKKAEEKLLKEAQDTKKVESPVLSTTKSVVGTLQERGLK